ncbi:MAG: nuclear transport factor 2 family protein [Solirubrobacterales bacterium]
MDQETRLDLLEARNDLLDLISRYAQGFDHQEAETLRSIWREDAVLDLGFFGRFVGIDEIMGAANQYWTAAPFMHHWMANPLLSIDIEAGTATAATELDCLCTYTGEGTSHIGGRYRDSFVREGGRWLIVERVFDIAFVTPMPDWKPAQGIEAEALEARA